IVPLFDDAAGRATRVVAVGGGTQAELWLRIVSEVTGLAQQVPEQAIGASYGDALLAAIGSGLVPPEPDPAGRETYDELFALYERLYPATADIAHALAYQNAVDDTSSSSGT